MFNKAEMLNRRASNPKFKSREILNVLALHKGEVVADIGAGGGYFSMLFAEDVGLDGKVYSLDTNPKMLTHIKSYAEENQLTNINTVLVNEDDLNLPEHGCDLIFLRNVFHHIQDKETYFAKLKSFLKPNGRIVIIDYKKTETFNFINLMKHYVEENLIISTLENAGYKITDSYDFLSEQSFNIFSL